MDLYYPSKGWFGKVDYKSKAGEGINPLLSPSPHLSYNMDKSNERDLGNDRKTVHLSVHPKKKTLVSI